MSIGAHGPITAEQARDKATVLLGTIKYGEDPQQEKARKRAEPMMPELAERFMTEHVLVHCKPSTQVGYRRYLDKHILPFFGDMKVIAIERADVATFHHSLRHIHTEANRCLEIISKMFNLAELWVMRENNTNPRRHIKKFPMKPRDRYLSKDEVKRLGQVLDEVKLYPDENFPAACCIQLLLLTGCRLGEIQTLKWEYIDWEKSVLNLPDSKTGAKLVYIGGVAVDLLKDILGHPTRPQDNPYVIWGRNAGAFLENIQKPWGRFRRMAGLEDVHIHDLRHSFASFAVSQGMSLAMIGRLLGHTQVQTTARYAHMMAEPMTQAASEVTDTLGNLMNMRPFTPAPQPTEDAVLIIGTRVAAPTFFTSDQAAVYLGVDQRLMENWRWRKTGPRFVKVGNRIRYDLVDLKDFVQAEI